MSLSKDNIVLKNDITQVMNIIKNCRSKWGTGYSTEYYPSASEICSASKINQYVTWLNDVKGRTNPGNSISVPGAVSAGSLMYPSFINSLISAGNSIYNHCHSNCHSNCNCNCDCAGCGTGTN